MEKAREWGFTVFEKESIWAISLREKRGSQGSLRQISDNNQNDPAEEIALQKPQSGRSCVGKEQKQCEQWAGQAL